MMKEGQASERQQQSPIRISKLDSHYVPALAAALYVHYPEGSFELKQKPDHHDLEWADPAVLPRVALDGKEATFSALHMHVTSEHEIAGQDLKLAELHFVHKLVNPEQGSTLVVLSVRVVVGDCHEACFSVPPSGSVKVNLEKLLPTAPYRFYRYEGSLTSTEYDEVVSWVVFAEPIVITASDIKIVAAHASQPDRGPQNLARRFVLRSFLA